MRIKFAKGKQKEFLKDVLQKIGSPSLRELLNRGVNVNYQTLKNYYSERRFLSEEIFVTLCRLSGIDRNSLDFNLLEDSWGQRKGGKISKRK